MLNNAEQADLAMIQLRFECLRLAMGLNDMDGATAISAAQSFYDFVTQPQSGETQ